MVTPQPSGDHDVVRAAWITGLLGLVGIVLGALLGNSGVYLANRTPGPTVTVTRTISSTATVTHTVPAQAAGAADPVKGSATPEVAQQADAPVFRQGSLLLLGGYSADLEAPATDPQWGTLTATEGDPDIGLKYSNGPVIAAQGGSRVTKVEKEAPGFQTCRQAQGYVGGSDGHVMESDIRTGDYICIYTSESRFSLIKILERSADPRSMVFYVITYKKNGDK